MCSHEVTLKHLPNYHQNQNTLGSSHSVNQFSEAVTSDAGAMQLFSGPYRFIYKAAFHNNCESNCMSTRHTGVLHGRDVDASILWHEIDFHMNAKR
jgi:hypothetical protein